MLKKNLSVFLCFLLCLSCAVVPAFASVTLMNAAEDIDHVQFIDDDNITGTVYISISDDGRFVTSDGIESGHVMAYIAVPISELAFDLTDWGYNGFIFDLREYLLCPGFVGHGRNAPLSEALHGVFLHLAERLSSCDADSAGFCLIHAFEDAGIV